MMMRKVYSLHRQACWHLKVSNVLEWFHTKYEHAEGPNLELLKRLKEAMGKFYEEQKEKKPTEEALPAQTSDPLVSKLLS